MDRKNLKRCRRACLKRLFISFEQAPHRPVYRPFLTARAAEKISLVGATVINPADGKVLPNATVVINGDKIERVSMGKQDAASLGKQIDCVGKFILPGYIDTHVHFFQSADLFTRPDGADLNSVRSLQGRSRVDQVAPR